MRRTSSFGLGLAVCGASAMLAVAPARADDGATVPADAAAIVASVAAAVPSMPEPQGPAAPQLPAAPETPVIPSVSATVPPAVPQPPPAPEPAPAVSSAPPAAPESAEPPVVAAAAEAIAAPDAPPAPPTDPHAADTGNTTPDNSSGITDAQSQTAPKIFVWNWFWNCATDEALPTVPTPPAGATTIVINWHWDCADPPPPLDVSQSTICTSCNIAISVRV